MKKRYSALCAVIALLMTACETLDGGNLIGPAGGFVFYDKGAYANGWRYLECTPENAGTGAWTEALQICLDYSLSGYDDWRMPDIDELEALLNSDHGSAVFKNGVYWSSTTDSVFSESAWGFQKGASPQHDNNTDSSESGQSRRVYNRLDKYLVWPVRQF